MKKELFNSFEVKITILKPFEVEKRVIYPIVNVLSLDAGFSMLDVSPAALIIEEDEDIYILHLSYEIIDDDELFELLSSFKQK